MLQIVYLLYSIHCLKHFTPNTNKFFRMQTSFASRPSGTFRLVNTSLDLRCSSWRQSEQRFKKKQQSLSACLTFPCCCTETNMWQNTTAGIKLLNIFLGRHGNQLDRDVLAPTCHLVHSLLTTQMFKKVRRRVWVCITVCNAEYQRFLQWSGYCIHRRNKCVLCVWTEWPSNFNCPAYFFCPFLWRN